MVDEPVAALVTAVNNEQIKPVNMSQEQGHHKWHIAKQKIITLGALALTQWDTANASCL